MTQETIDRMQMAARLLKIVGTAAARVSLLAAEMAAEIRELAESLQQSDNGDTITPVSPDSTEGES